MNKKRIIALVNPRHPEILRFYLNYYLEDLYQKTRKNTKSVEFGTR